MNLRKWAKFWFYGHQGSFPYFGVRVHFPKGSVGFRVACEQGIFEADNVRFLQQLCRPETVMFDIGANLGLMAIPVLSAVADSRVISFEPSPNTLPCLRRTVAGSAFGNRWQLIEKAVAATPGVAEFSVSDPRESLFDGFKSTQRVAEAGRVTVDVTSVDIEWKRLGWPNVSVIKIDVEGAELGVLEGAVACIAATHPHVLVEWNRVNLDAYKIAINALTDFVVANQYCLYALPDIIPVRSNAELELHSIRTESFLMAPA